LVVISEMFVQFIGLDAAGTVSLVSYTFKT